MLLSDLCHQNENVFDFGHVVGQNKSFNKVYLGSRAINHLYFCVLQLDWYVLCIKSTLDKFLLSLYC